MPVYRIQELTPTGEAVIESTLTLAQVAAAIAGAPVSTPAPPLPSSAWPASADEAEVDRLYKALTRDLARPDTAEQFNHRDELARGVPLEQILRSIRDRFPEG